jgi:Leucine-rich repeat (LRR) protein
MPLTTLDVSTISMLTSLEPIAALRLTALRCDRTQIFDLSPLKDMPLTSLNCADAQVIDLAPLRGLPLKQLWCDFHADRDLDTLQVIKSLAQINDQPAAKFLQQADVQHAAFVLWRKQTAILPPDKQLEAVAAKLKERNPAFDGKLTPKVVGDHVTELTLSTDNVTDLSPLRALPELQSLNCGGSAVGRGKLVDLSALRGSKLTSLSCPNNSICDLAPLKELPLTYLNINGVKTLDLSPLRDLPLKEIRCYYLPMRDAEILRAIKTLETVNDKPAKDLLK